jgi:uncharacterized protein (TIGR03437 family)
MLRLAPRCWAAVFLSAFPAFAQHVITTYAGTDWLFKGDGQLGTEANIGPPVSIAIDSHGDLFTIINSMNTLLKLTPSGTVSVVAGAGLRTFAGDGGPARAAFLAYPQAVALGPGGVIYIAEPGANRIRKIAQDGTISTFAGTGFGAFAGDEGPAIHANVAFPLGVAADQNGNVFILDSGNARIRKVDPSGIISTIAGNGQHGFLGDDIPATNASIAGAGGLAVDPSGSLYVADMYTCRIRKIDSAGIIHTVAGTNFCGFKGDGGPALSAGLFNPAGLAFDNGGNIYIADSGNERIRKVDAAGNISTLAGNGTNAFQGDGSAPLAAAFSNPVGVAVDSNGNVFVADRDNARIRKIPSGAGGVATVLGTGLSVGDGGPSAGGLFNNPLDLAIDPNGTVVVADQNNVRIRSISPGGIISTAVGTGRQGYSPDGTPAIASLLTNPESATVSPQGQVVYSDGGLIRTVTPNGVIRTIAGGGPCCTITTGVPATQAFITSPDFLRFDGQGNLYFANGSSVVQKLTTSGTIVTVAGNGNPQFSGDGGPAIQAGLGRVVGLALDAAGNLYIADYLNSRIRKVDPTGTISTIAGNGTIAFSPDGALAATASLMLNSGFGGLAIDRTGTVYYSDTNRVRFIAKDGTIRTFAGSNLFGFSGDGGLASAAGVETPCGIAFDSAGNLLFVDQFNGRVREVLSGPVPIITLSQKVATFFTLAGGSSSSQPITVVNGALGTLNFGVAVSTASGGNWLSTSTASGGAAAGSPGVVFKVTVDPGNLGPGDYYGQVIVSAPGVPNSPQSITVVAHILAPASITTDNASLQPGGLVFVAPQGGADPAAQTLNLTTLSPQPVDYGATVTFGGGQPFFTLTNLTGKIFANSPATFAVQPSIAGLAPGTYNASITFAVGQAPIQSAQILLIVTGPGTNPASRAASNCTASKLLPVITSLSGGFAVTAAWPITIEANVFDDCGQPLLNGGATASFSTTDPPLALNNLQNGEWSATWQTQSVAPQVQITVQATAKTGGLTGSAVISGGLQPNANPPPQIASGGVLNGASYVIGSSLAPGSLISIFGTHLGTSSANAHALPLPTSLNATQVYVASRPLPLLFVSDTQINAQIPYDLVINAKQQVVISRGNTVSLPEPISMTSEQSGIFTQTGNGKGIGIVVVYSGGSSALVGSKHAVKAGDAIVIYATGLGDVEPRVIAGTAAPITPLSNTVNPVAVTIGGKSANVFFSGLAPGFAGLYQVNAFVPSNVPTGEQVPLVITQNGASSTPVTIPVQ